MKNKKYSAWQGFVHALNLPEDAFVSQSHMQLFGQKELVIEGAKGILEYNEDAVRVQVKERCVLIRGERLRVDMFLENVIVVRGLFSLIAFE